ncbi:hypothetical protein [Peribacillus butanolivorans]|uniref:hypothetical protein n=1 Tax=Peribacillus butanolivorans TaxID=421767 RepID=UPI00167F7577|nr:hypothetical protein [Peribacillus butanolivorans]QNU03183.1 hypothetical protein GM240_03945 [Peribacillus butanolivorans]
MVVIPKQKGYRGFSFDEDIIDSVDKRKKLELVIQALSLSNGGIRQYKLTLL